MGHFKHNALTHPFIAAKSARLQGAVLELETYFFCS